MTVFAPHQWWTPEMIADHLEEAADTLRRLPKIHWKARLTRWPDVIRQGVALLDDNTRRCRPGAPSPQAIDRMDAVLEWLLPLPLEQRRILWARACGISWRQLADMDGRSHVTLRKVWAQALSGIAMQLMGARRVASSPA